MKTSASQRLGLLMFIYCVVNRERIGIEDGLFLLLTLLMYVGYITFWSPWKKDGE